MASFLRFAWSERSGETRLWIALGASILLHALFLATWPRIGAMLGSVGDPDFGRQGGRSLPLTARIVAPPSPRVAEQPVLPEPATPPPAPRAQPRPEPAPKAAPKVLTGTPERPTVALPPRQEAARPPGQSDFLADLSSRRSSREQTERRESAPAPAAPSAPLSFGTSAGPGGERRNGGYFVVERMTWTDATLAFYRWNRGVQRLEVPRENQISIQLAVIKQVIALMRENGFNGDVNWLSERLGRSVEISAREKDSAKLEAFLMLEFFSADPLRRPAESFQK
jgi:hypothetical protein